MNWDRKLLRALILVDDTKLTTLRDAADALDPICLHDLVAQILVVDLRQFAVDAGLRDLVGIDDLVAKAFAPAIGLTR